MTASCSCQGQCRSRQVEARAPCLILLDEVLQYLTKALAVRTHEGNLAETSLTFIKELCTAAASVPTAAVVATLTSSNLEDYASIAGEDMQERLSKVVGTTAFSTRSARTRSSARRARRCSSALDVPGSRGASSTTCGTLWRTRSGTCASKVAATGSRPSQTSTRSCWNERVRSATTASRPPCGGRSGRWRRARRSSASNPASLPRPTFPTASSWCWVSWTSTTASAVRQAQRRSPQPGRSSITVGRPGDPTRTPGCWWPPTRQRS
jgi:hypothetical protein